MTRLSYQALESLWTSAGGSPDLAPTMAAIAVAESGGDPSSLNDTPRTGDYSVGLWQINYFGDMLPGRTREFGSPSALRASPTAQARAAVAIYHQQGLKAWTTWTSGAYRRYLQGANYNGSDGPPADGSGATGSGSSGGVTQASDTHADCLIGINLPIVGYQCLLTRGQGRAVLGASLLVSGAVVGAIGLVILAAYGLKQTGALDQAAKAAAVVPGAGKLAGTLARSAGALKHGPAATKRGK